MNNYIILLFFVLFTINSKPVKPREIITVSSEHVNKCCSLEFDSNIFQKMVELRIVAITMDSEALTFPSEVLSKLELALISNLDTYVDKNYNEIGVYNRSGGLEE